MLRDEEDVALDEDDLVDAGLGDAAVEKGPRVVEAPVVAITGGGGDVSRAVSYAEWAEIIGARAVLQKPFTRNDLRQVLVTLLPLLPPHCQSHSGF